MFTLGVMTDEISQDFAHALDVIEEFGVGTVELHEMWDKNICDLDSHELTQVVHMVRQRGFAVCDIASQFLRCPIDDLDAYNEHIKILERSIQIAPLFDCQLVRCFSFWREDDLETHWDTILERLELPVRMAESAGVTLAFENVRSCNIGTGAETTRLMETINSPNLRVIWDPGNAYVSGEARPYPDGYELVKPWIIHVHVKDAVLSPEGESVWKPIGAGKVDYAGQFKALADDGYDGV
ncbi:MAG: sugar phosphate isomerase/epimerase, partial [Chloroflexota bacterium]|nr:sugar phosphate isomerase/epimerase [Chloroflexota bacterium]